MWSRFKIARTPVWIGPAHSDQVAVPTEQRGRAHEEPLEMPAGEQLCQSGEQRPVGRLDRRPVVGDQRISRSMITPSRVL